MSCGCNNSPCNCQPRPSVCCTPTVESVTYTFENSNLVGIGVFDNETDYLVQFRGVVSNSAALTVTLDAGNNAIVFDFDQDALVADIPDADTTTRGILETATNAEAIAKAALDKILVPSNLAAMGASETFAGLVELATDAETLTGTSTTLAVHPAGLAFAISASNTLTFTDATARGNTTPIFPGQFGAQIDTQTAWLAPTTVTGSWNPILTLGVTNLAEATTVLNLNNFNLEVLGFGEIAMFNTSLSNAGGNITFTGAISQYGDFGGLSQVVNYDNTVFQVQGATVGVQSLIGTTNLSEATFYTVSNFVSTHNVQMGYTAFANPATLRTCDTATVTLQQLAQIVGTLIEDLKVPLLPAT